jgi:hypothetical protein
MRQGSVRKVSMLHVIYHCFLIHAVKTSQSLKKPPPKRWVVLHCTRSPMAQHRVHPHRFLMQVPFGHCLLLLHWMMACYYKIDHLLGGLMGSLLEFELDPHHPASPRLSFLPPRQMSLSSPAAQHYPTVLLFFSNALLAPA